MDINFELYKIFYYAAKLENFSDAGEKLFMSQSAVSQAIKNLEEKTGALLFFRKNRKVKLTSEGELLFKHVEQAFNFLKTAESKLQETQSLSSGEIRIGIGDTICKYYLVPYIQKFYANYPNIKIHIVNRTSSQILEVLKNGMIDFGIVTLPVAGKGFIVEEFLSVEDILVASPRFSELKATCLPLPGLADYPLLLLEKGSSTRRNIDVFFREHHLEVSPEIELDSIDLLLEFAKIGMGIAHVLKESALAAILKGDLFEVKTIEKFPPRKLGTVSMQDVPLSRAASAFVEMLK